MNKHGISRRDFLNGMALCLAGGTTLSPAEILAATAPPLAAAPYPPALTGMRGSHAGSFEIAHALARGGRKFTPPSLQTDPTYDLVVVGGGISGLAAAKLFRDAHGSQAKILVLDNHDDFGGHARRNELDVDGSTLLGYGFVLVFTVPMVRIMIQSGVNANELTSMPISMATWVAGSVGGVYPFFAPTVGALGAFLAGSNTVSNLMLSQYQYSVAQALGVSGATMVAAQSIGAAAGNMIAIHNVVAASATVGVMGREGLTLRRTVIPTLYYVVLAGTLTMLTMYVLKLSDPLIGVALK